MKTTTLVDFDRFEAKATEELESAQAACAKFAEEFKADPAYHLSWGMDAFLQAARVKVYAEVVHHCTAVRSGEYKTVAAESFISMLAKEYTRDVMRAGRNPARSTSVTSNLMESCVTQAKAEVAERLAYYL